MKIPEHKDIGMSRFWTSVATFSIVCLIQAYLFRLSDPILAAYLLKVIILSLNTVLQYSFTLH